MSALITNVPIKAETLDTHTSEDSTIASALRQLTDHASEVIMNSMGLLGIRYQRGGKTPESGFDCSGLVHHVFKEVLGLDLPRTAKEISQIGQKIDPNDIQPGDLVFFNTLKNHFSHVGIYLGDNRFIHSPAQGGQVRIESMDLDYWKKRFNGIRRINEPPP